MQIINNLKHCLAFTKVYKSYEDKAIREVECLRLQLNYILQPINEEDLIAGMMQHTYLGFSIQHGGVYTYFFHEEDLIKDFSKVKSDLDSNTINEIEEMIEYWKEECTINHMHNLFKEKFGYVGPANFKQPGIANSDGRVAGMNVDVDKLIRLGIPGLRQEIAKFVIKNGDNSFYKGLNMALDLLIDVIKRYEKEAIQADKTETAQILHNIAQNKPETFKEGLQLFWIYAIVSDLIDYGRMDVYLGDLYAQDIDNGTLSEEEGIKWLSSLYTHFKTMNKIYDCRVIIGGKGRRNEENADRLAMAIMEVSGIFMNVVPQLTLRYYKGMNDALYEKALRLNALGATYPIIYSDDTNIPAVKKLYDVTLAEAEQYLPFGCGEYVMEGLSTGTPNNGINLLKALEVTIFNGYDNIHKMMVGKETGEIADITDFEELWDRYAEQLSDEIIKVAWNKRFNYQAANDKSSYLFTSLLMNDCIERGLGLLDGGVRYMNASSEIFGIISTADSFSAIKKVVFEDKKFNMAQLREMLFCNFSGYEEERQYLVDAPKYGNDDDIADTMATRVFNHIADKTIEAGEIAGIHKYHIVSVNNSMSAEWGEYCMASADGRKEKQPMSNGNGPSIGADKNGITALLNSMSKFDPEKHVGVINNIRFTKEMFNNSFDKIKSLLAAFYENNGVQTNITVIGKEDLEQALIHPDKYKNLLVRIGGFSARFVELAPVIQNEIILRTTYR